MVVRGLAAAALPLMALTLFLTFSRSGVGAAAIALLVLFAFGPGRLERLATLVVAGVASALLILVADRSDLVFEGPNSVTGATGEGNELLLLLLVVCVLVGLLQVVISIGFERWSRPRWAEPSRGFTIGMLSGVLATVIFVALVAGIPSKVDDAWTEFKAPQGVAEVGSDRFQSFSGNGRYQYWEAAVEQNATRPFSGRGSGTFEYGPTAIRRRAASCEMRTPYTSRLSASSGSWVLCCWSPSSGSWSWGGSRAR